LSLYYGWVIVGVSLVSMAYWFGVRSSFSVFYTALLDEFPWGRAEAAGVQSLALIVYTILAPLVGGLIDRYGPRRVVVPGILLLGGGLILCSSVQDLFQFYLYYGLLVAAGVTSVGIVSYTAVLAHWFERRRGTANGIAVSGMGLGTFVFVLLSQGIIARWGWRPAFLVLGGLVLALLLPLNAWLLRHKPQQMGLLPDGVSPQRRGRHKEGNESLVPDPIWAGTDWTLRRAAKEGRFWALMAFPFLVVTAVYIVLVHHFRYLVDAGVDPMIAAYVLASVGIISSVFRILWGWLSDRLGREMTYTLGVAAMCAGIGSLILLGVWKEQRLLYPFVALFGVGWGATAPMFMSTAADLFQGRAFGLIYGILEGVIGVGGALGAWVAGYLFDQTRTYLGAFAIGMLTAALSCLFIWLAAPRKVRAKG